MALLELGFKLFSGFLYSPRDSLVKLSTALFLSLTVAFVISVTGTIVIWSIMFVLFQGPAFVIWSRMNPATILARFLGWSFGWV